ncbi:MAG: carboxypeptidase-like regulatory domain-containing protein [Silvibacterium sp.]
MRIPCARWAFTLCLTPLLALGQRVSAPPPQPATIFGTVVDVYNAAVPSATVVIDSPAPADRATVKSNDSGFFLFKNLRHAVPYHITISAKGFADWTSPSLTLQPGQQLDLASVRLKIAVVQTTVTAASEEQIAAQEVKVAEQQRVIGIFPNFYVVYTQNPVPLTTKLKYELAFRTSVDLARFAGAATLAAMNQAGDIPDYPQGWAGYGQRFGAAYTDSFTDVIIGGGILPSLFHQDPRYFYQGTGSKRSRLLHAVASPLVCRGDNGRRQFNISSVGGDLASGAISNLYYPVGNRGPGLVFNGTLISTGGRVIAAIAQEFLFRSVTPSAKKHP